MQCDTSLVRHRQMHRIYNRLVRDNIPHILNHGKVQYSACYLNNEQVLSYCFSKVKGDIESFKLYINEQKPNLAINHLVDIQTILFKLAKTCGVDRNDLLSLEELMSYANGEFNKNCVMKYIKEPNVDDTDEEFKNDCV